MQAGPKLRVIVHNKIEIRIRDKGDGIPQTFARKFLILSS